MFCCFFCFFLTPKIYFFYLVCLYYSVGRGEREVSKEVLAAESDGGAAGSAASVYGGGGDGKREAITREA
jgi:hypothetical protein